MVASCGFQGLFQLIEAAVVLRCKQEDVDIVKVGVHKNTFLRQEEIFNVVQNGIIFCNH